MKIPYMPETEITLLDDGSISIAQKDFSGGEDHFVSFPAEMAKTITDEITRLAQAAGPRDETPA